MRPRRTPPTGRSARWPGRRDCRTDHPAHLETSHTVQALQRSAIALSRPRVGALCRANRRIVGLSADAAGHARANTRSMHQCRHRPQPHREFLDFRISSSVPVSRRISTLSWTYADRGSGPDLACPTPTWDRNCRRKQRGTPGSNELMSRFCFRVEQNLCHEPDCNSLVFRISCSVSVIAGRWHIRRLDIGAGVGTQICQSNELRH